MHGIGPDCRFNADENLVPPVLQQLAYTVQTYSSDLADENCHEGGLLLTLWAQRLIMINRETLCTYGAILDPP